MSDFVKLVEPTDAERETRLTKKTNPVRQRFLQNMKSRRFSFSLAARTVSFFKTDPVTKKQKNIVLSSVYVRLAHSWKQCASESKNYTLAIDGGFQWTSIDNIACKRYTFQLEGNNCRISLNIFGANLYSSNRKASIPPSITSKEWVAATKIGTWIESWMSFMRFPGDIKIFLRS